MKKKEFPFPALIPLGILFADFLIGYDKALVSVVFMLLLFLGGWYFIGPDLEPPSDPVQRSYWRLRAREELAGQDPLIILMTVQLRALSARLYEDKAFRQRLAAIVLALVLAITAASARFGREVILRRAVIVMGLCALGLAALLAAWIRRRLRLRRGETDKAAYPDPWVNMNYDRETVGAEEYEALRKKYLERDTEG